MKYSTNTRYFVLLCISRGDSKSSIEIQKCWLFQFLWWYFEFVVCSRLLRGNCWGRPALICLSAIKNSLRNQQDSHLVIFTAFPGVVTGNLQVSVLHVILSQEFVRHTLVLYITSLMISEMRRLYKNMIIILYTLKVGRNRRIIFIIQLSQT